MTPIQERIVKAFEATGKTAKAFCEDAGLGPTYISNLKCNHSHGTPSTVITRLCTTYGINRTWLETGEGEMFLPRKDKEPKPITEMVINGESWVLKSSIPEAAPEVIEKEVVKEVVKEVPATMAEVDGMPFVITSDRWCGFLEDSRPGSIRLRGACHIKCFHDDGRQALPIVEFFTDITTVGIGGNYKVSRSHAVSRMDIYDPGMVFHFTEDAYKTLCESFRNHQEVTEG